MSARSPDFMTVLSNKSVDDFSGARDFDCHACQCLYYMGWGGEKNIVGAQTKRTIGLRRPGHHHPTIVRYFYIDRLLHQPLKMLF